MTVGETILVAFVVTVVVIAVSRWRAARAFPVGPARKGPPLGPGDRVLVCGGYDGAESAWLGGRAGYSGTLERFIQGQNEAPAAVVRTDTPVTVGDVSGEILVLELRWVGATWHSEAFCHVELCAFEPDDEPPGERRRGAWVESHASVRHLGEGVVREDTRESAGEGSPG